MDTKPKNIKESILITLAASVGMFVIAGIAWVIFLTATEMDKHLEMYTDVQQQLGFTYATPYTEDQDEVLMITNISEGGVMDMAGFQPGDQYNTEDGLVIPFINLFVFHQGEQIMIPIIRGTEYLTIPVTVPDLDLDVNPYDLHYPFTKYKK